MKVLILGDGLLGSTLHKETGWSVLSRKKDGFDITNTSTYSKILQQSPTSIINCTGYVNNRYDSSKELHWRVNYEGVLNLTDFCNKHSIKLIHISSDTVYANSIPNATEEDVTIHQPSYYSYTKLLSDSYIRVRSNHFLLIRCNHKPTPFPYDEAWVDQIGNFDYIDVLLGKLLLLIENNATGVYNVGTEPKSMYELAKRTVPNVVPIYKGDSRIPHDKTMCLDKYSYFEKQIQKK